MAAYGWDWIDNGVAIFCDGVKIGEFATDFPSRDGLAIVDALRNAEAAMVADEEPAAKYGRELAAGGGEVRVF